MSQDISMTVPSGHKAIDIIDEAASKVQLADYQQHLKWNNMNWN